MAAAGRGRAAGEHAARIARHIISIDIPLSVGRRVGTDLRPIHHGQPQREANRWPVIPIRLAPFTEVPR